MNTNFIEGLSDLLGFVFVIFVLARVLDIAKINIWIICAPLILSLILIIIGIIIDYGLEDKSNRED